MLFPIVGLCGCYWLIVAAYCHSLFVVGWRCLWLFVILCIRLMFCVLDVVCSCLMVCDVACSCSMLIDVVCGRSVLRFVLLVICASSWLIVVDGLLFVVWHCSLSFVAACCWRLLSLLRMVCGCCSCCDVALRVCVAVCRLLWFVVR